MINPTLPSGFFWANAIVHRSLTPTLLELSWGSSGDGEVSGCSLSFLFCTAFLRLNR